MQQGVAAAGLLQPTPEHEGKGPAVFIESHLPGRVSSAGGGDMDVGVDVDVDEDVEVDVNVGVGADVNVDMDVEVDVDKRGEQGASHSGERGNLTAGVW